MVREVHHIAAGMLARFPRLSSVFSVMYQTCGYNKHNDTHEDGCQDCPSAANEHALDNCEGIIVPFELEDAKDPHEEERSYEKELDSNAW